MGLGEMSDSIKQSGALSAPCPKCGGQVYQEDRAFRCDHCGFSITRLCAGRSLEADEAKQLITEGLVGPLNGFRRNSGELFTAVLKLDEDFKLVFQFQREGQAAK